MGGLVVVVVMVAGGVGLAGGGGGGGRGSPAGSAPWWVKNLVLLGAPFAPVGWHREGLDTLWRDGGVLAMPTDGVLRTSRPR